MANSAIVAGLLAGYTVGAVVTALAAARDVPAPGPSPADLARAAHPSAAVRCAGTLRRRRARCLRPLERAGLVSSPRR